MPKTSSLNALNCPNCGAPLEFMENQWTTRCNFCGSHVARSEEAVTPDEQERVLRTSMIDGRVIDRDSLGESVSVSSRSFVIKFRNGQPVVIAPGESARSNSTREAAPQVTVSIPSYTATPGRASCLSAVIGLVVVFIALGVILFSIPQTGQMLRLLVAGDFDGMLTAMPSVGRRIYVRESAAFAPAAKGVPPNLVVLTMQSPLDGNTQEYRLVEVSGADLTMLWQSPPLGDNVYRTPVLVNDEFVYTLAKDRLMALSRSDGSLAWEAQLADVVSSSVCADCVRLEGEHLFALSDDGTLQAFDALEGEELWSFRADQDSPRGLYILDGRPAFIDQDEKNHGLVRLFDPASGEMETAQPACSEGSSTDYLSWTSSLYLAPDGKSFYVFYDLFTTCVQRWDAKTVEKLWSSSPPKAASMGPWPLVTKDALYFNGAHQIIAVDANTGDWRTVIDDDEYAFAPMTVVGNRLLVRATRERGSKRFEIWAVDESGDNGVDWTFDLDENEPFDPPDAAHSIIDDNQSVWTWRVRSGDLLLVHFWRAEDDISHAIRLETLDVKTGKRRGTREIPLKVSTSVLSAPAFTLWHGDILWIAMEGSLLGVDVEAGEIIGRWP
ncbi:MAG: PQQ-binding-like beta-propeller repeat protein [Anaerolineae bacterium]|nr:PQQ-binding-like beta-propeller repeat protein [Anaerolineae bacterium]